MFHISLGPAYLSLLHQPICFKLILTNNHRDHTLMNRN